MFGFTEIFSLLARSRFPSRFYWTMLFAIIPLNMDYTHPGFRESATFTDILGDTLARSGWSL